MKVGDVVTGAELAQAQREFGWTENRTGVAIKLFSAGASDSQVASLIGGVSRNAVIGMRHRKGVTLGMDPALVSRPTDIMRPRAVGADPATLFRPRPEKRIPQPGRARVPREARDVVIRTARVKPDRGPPPPPIVDAAIPIEQRRSLVELDDSCCHWPVGDPARPEFFFCGAVAARKDPLDLSSGFHPYCASHMRRAHQPWQRRQGQENPKSRLQIAEAANARRV